MIEDVKKPDVQQVSVLHRLLQDEAIVIRLIKQDIISSIMLQKAWSQDLKILGIMELELNQIIFDLMSLDRCSNYDALTDYYNKQIEDYCKMIVDFPSIDINQLAVNCFLELKKLREWT